MYIPAIGNWLFIGIAYTQKLRHSLSFLLSREINILTEHYKNTFRAEARIFVIWGKLLCKVPFVCCEVCAIGAAERVGHLGGWICTPQF